MRNFLSLWTASVLFVAGPVMAVPVDHSALGAYLHIDGKMTPTGSPRADSLKVQLQENKFFKGSRHIYFIENFCLGYFCDSEQYGSQTWDYSFHFYGKMTDPSRELIEIYMYIDYEYTWKWDDYFEQVEIIQWESWKDGPALDRIVEGKMELEGLQHDKSKFTTSANIVIEVRVSSSRVLNDDDPLNSYVERPSRFRFEVVPLPVPLPQSLSLGMAATAALLLLSTYSARRAAGKNRFLD